MKLVALILSLILSGIFGGRAESYENGHKSFDNAHIEPASQDGVKENPLKDDVLCLFSNVSRILSQRVQAVSFPHNSFIPKVKFAPTSYQFVRNGKIFIPPRIRSFQLLLNNRPSSPLSFDKYIYFIRHLLI